LGGQKQPEMAAFANHFFLNHFLVIDIRKSTAYIKRYYYGLLACLASATLFSALLLHLFFSLSPG
jgi:hypothetical protein